MTFGLINVLTGTFVNLALEAAQHDRKAAIQAQLEERQGFVVQIKELFQAADSDDTGMISRGEFEKMLENEQLKAYFKHLEVDLAEASGLFDVLDHDNSGDISVDEFVDGFLRLSGEATAADCATLLRHQKKIEKRLQKMSDEMHYNVNLEPPKPSCGRGARALPAAPRRGRS